MGKFDGILLCTDLDGTLLDDNCRVSAENKKAIDYFKKEGGLFTFVTGRVPSGARLMLEHVQPNIPAVTFNGAGVYDFEKDELLWGVYLDEKAKDVVAYVEEKIPEVGLIICTDRQVHFSKMNKWVDKYIKDENAPLITTPYLEVKEPWKKVILVVSTETIPEIKRVIAESEFYGFYDFMQSSPVYYEILPKGARKGTGLERLVQLIGADKNRVIAVGDNENDISMIKTAAFGIAVANAAESLREIADMVTVSNNESALAKIIDALDSGEIKKLLMKAPTCGRRN
ncbi:MAG: HAD family phosphatase [Clostridia bacterium]|nr:HAD family phosphatase [Clostridia bacterium]